MTRYTMTEATVAAVNQYACDTCGRTTEKRAEGCKCGALLPGLGRPPFPRETCDGRIRAARLFEQGDGI